MSTMTPPGVDAMEPGDSASGPAVPQPDGSDAVAETRAEGSGGLTRWLVPLVSLALLGVAMWVLRHELAAHSYREIARTVRDLPNTQVTEALLWTLLAYLVLPGYDVLALSYVGRLRERRRGPAREVSGDPVTEPRHVGVGRAGFAGIIAYGVSQTLGFPAFTGAAVRYRFWTAWGLSAAEIARAASFAGATFTLGMALVSGLALVLEPAADLATVHIATTLARGIGTLLLLGVFAFLVWSVSSGGRRLRLPARLAARIGRGAADWRFEVPRPRLAFAQLAVALVDWTAAAAVLWVLLPQVGRPSFGAFAGVFVVAQFAGLISHVPGGIGVFETIVLLALEPTVAGDDAIAALLAYRAVYYLLPFTVALVLFAAYEAHSRSRHVRALTGAMARSGTRLGGAARRTGLVAASLGPSLVPTVVAAAVFVAGTVLLLSGATPSIHHRVRAVDDLLPEGIIEASHLLGSMAGAMLLVLAWAIRRRLGAAWGLTVGLLSLGIVASLLKGLDWEEALLLAVVLAVVLPFRRAFYRRSALTSEPFEPGWLMAIVAVLGVTTWLGLFAYRHVEYRNELWWHVSVTGDAPRFLRASLASAGMLVVLGAARLLRPARPTVASPDQAALARAAGIADASSDAAAWLALLGDKALLFRDPTELQLPDGKPRREADAVDGFVQYGVAGRSWVAMGDPVVADGRIQGPTPEARGLAALRARGALAWRFKEEADAHGGWPVFYEVSAELLPLYVDLGLTLLKLGEEARVPLAEFALEGNARKNIRRGVKEVEKTGATFEMIPAEGVPALLPRLRAVSDGWLAQKAVREKGFSLGFFDEAYLARFPVAVVRDAAGEIVAFANVWPGGGKHELSVDLMRFDERAPKGVMDYLFAQLMLWGKAQGFQWFNLGMAPLSGLEARQLAPLWVRAGSWLYRHGEHFYNYQGLRKYKEKYDPVWTPKYLAAPGGLALPRILANVTALISGGLTGVVRR